MPTGYLQEFKQQYLKDFKTVVHTTSMLLILVLGVTLYATIDRFDLGWIKPVVAFLVTLILIMLNARSPFAVRLFKRLRLNLLFPAIDEMIVNQERRERNLAVVNTMSIMLTFYHLWPYFAFKAIEPEQKPSRFARLAQFFRRLRRKKEPIKPSEPPFSQIVLPQLPLAESDDERIKNCVLVIERFKNEVAAHISPDLLELLFEERAGRAIGPLTEESEARLRPHLARVLRESHHLPPELLEPPTPGYQGKLEDLLPPLRDYDFHETEARLLALRGKNYRVAEKMSHVLAYYRITDLTPPEVMALANSVPAEDDEDARLRNCAQNVSDCLTGHERHYAPDLIELLYRERYKLPVYHQPLDKTLKGQLAQVLCKSGRLPAQVDLPLEVKDIELILDGLTDFTLDGVIAQLVAYQTNRREDLAVIRNMIRVLRYYDLLQRFDIDMTGGVDERGDVCLSRPFEQELQNHLFQANTLAGRIAAAAAALIPFLKHDEGPLSSLTLALLYRERQTLERPDPPPEIIPELAQVLLCCGRLPAQDEYLPAYTAQDVEHLLRHLPEFTLSGIVDALNLLQARRRENKNVVMGMERTLVFFNLFPYLKPEVYEQSEARGPAWQDTTRVALIRSLPPVHTPEALLQNCAANASGYRQAETSPISAGLLELLYRENHEMDTGTRWRPQSQMLIPALAELLLNCGHLPDRQKGFPYQQADLQRILRPLQDFSLPLVNGVLERLGIIWQQATGYHNFLAENGVSGWTLHKETLLTRLEEMPHGLPVDKASLPQLEEQLFDLLLWVGQESIAYAYNQLPPALRHSISLIALALYLAKFERRNAELLAETCQLAAQDNEAVLIALAYLEFRADMESGVRELAGRPFVSVAYLIDHWQERVEEKQQGLEGFAKEVATVRQALADGQWLTRLWQMLEQTWHNLSEENKRLHRKVEANKAARKAAETAFRHEVRIETLERFLEARTVNAYLLAFDARRGRLADLIDCLRLRPTTHAERGEKRTQRQIQELHRKLDILKAHDISLQVEDDGQWKYHFAQYTDNTRIGVVPYGWTLEKFYREFDRDLRELTDHTTIAEKKILVPDYEWQEVAELERTEVILHRFGLRNHHVVRLAHRSQAAINNMLQLFASQLKDSDLVANISYGQEERISPVDATLAAGTIADFAADSFPLQIRERQQIESSDEQLKQLLLEHLEMESIPELGRAVVQEAEIRAEAETTLAQLLSDHVPQLEDKGRRARRIAAAYLNTLHEIAAVAYRAHVE